MSNIREMPGEGMKNDNAYQFNGEVIIFSLIDCLSFGGKVTREKRACGAGT
jgi:hypothetical protein